MIYVNTEGDNVIVSVRAQSHSSLRLKVANSVIYGSLEIQVATP